MWPESAALQPTAVKIAVLHLPGNHHAARHLPRMNAAINAAATRDTTPVRQLSLQQLVMSRRPQQAECVVAGAGGEAPQQQELRQHGCGQLRLPPRAAGQRVWLGSGSTSASGSELRTQCAAPHDDALGDDVIGGEGAPLGPIQRAWSNGRLTRQPEAVAKGESGSSSSHAAGTDGGTEGAGTGAGADGGTEGPSPLRPLRLHVPKVAVDLGAPLATPLAVSDAGSLAATPPPSDRTAKRASSISVSRQLQLNPLP